MEFDLVPREKIIMRMRKRLAIVAMVFLTILWVGIVLCDGFKEVTILTLTFIAFEMFFWYPYVRYGRISQSVAKFASDGIAFMDAKGNCWRFLPYSSISKVRKTTINGTFYGEKKDEVEGVYVCFYLNGVEDIPDVPYHRLFVHQDFSMMYSQDNLIETLKKYGIKVCNIGDEDVCSRDCTDGNML